MLVMTTIFISKMESLPPTSTTKMIDYWLILCQLVPFTQVVLLTAIEFFKEKDQEDEVADLADVKASSTTINIQQVEELDTKPKVATIRPPRESSVAMLKNIGNPFYAYSNHSQDSTISLYCITLKKSCSPFCLAHL